MNVGKIRAVQFCSFVPEHSFAREDSILKFSQFVSQYKSKLLVLTGAGISTESGIPDYRSEKVGLYSRRTTKPITYQEFMHHSYTRHRYWARSYVGWPQFSTFQPNITHRILRCMQGDGIVKTIITQNVDTLHTKAGSPDVIELHGNLFTVVCTRCAKYSVDRHEFQKMLKELNPTMVTTGRTLRPDGDVELSEDELSTFMIPNCPICDGYLKPRVVFFGENIPMNRIRKTQQEVSECSSLLVLGSSLSVYSSFRIVLECVDTNKPVCIVNIGETRGDDVASLKIEAKCSEVLSKCFPSYINK